MFKQDWPHCTQCTVNNAVLWRLCPVPHETRHIIATEKPSCIPTADTTLLILDRMEQEYRYSIHMHVQSNANDMVPPALSFPTWDIGQDRTGQHSPMDMYYWHGCPTCPVASFPRGRGRDSPVEVYTCTTIYSHGYLGYVYMTNLLGIWILFIFFLHSEDAAFTQIHYCSLKNVHIIRIIIKSLHAGLSWAHEDINHRTELAFARADTVTEKPPKAKQTQKAKPKQEVCDTWQSAADGLRIHLFTWASSYIFPVPFSKSPLKPSF